VKTRALLGDITLTILFLCAVITTGLVVRREILSRPHDTSRIATSRWKEFVSTGNRIGPSHSPTTVLVFSDYQCPFCRALSVNLARLRARYPEQLTVISRHFPLEGVHPLAYDAALAAECASKVGKFQSMDSTLFQNQSRIGQDSWGVFATEAGVSDTASLVHCVNSARHADRIRSDVNAGEALGVQGTPTVLINGEQFRIPPTFAVLDSIVRRGGRTTH
jgi:protein-disulfide isomerase